jgi:excisionase family DNA binding protein
MNAVPAVRNMISLDDAAQRLDVHPRTIRRAVADGRLAAYRIGPRLIRVDAAEVDALLAPIPTVTTR